MRIRCLADFLLDCIYDRHSAVDGPASRFSGHRPAVDVNIGLQADYFTSRLATSISISHYLHAL